ncbi:MAG: nicotinate-nucleotide adenylyltransferase [Solirubrobacteraceae bacterium]
MAAAATRVGVLGGTFNPPHAGHLACARAARTALGLDVVLLVTAARPPHKPFASDPGAEVRFELCQAAASGEPGLQASRAELDRPGPSYTVDTLRAMHSERPDAEFTLVVGGDMATNLPTWREPEAVLGLARLAVAERAGSARALIAERLAPLAGEDRVSYLDMEPVDVSSSLVRDRVARGESIDGLVPDAVAQLIAEGGLYAVAA